MNTETNTEIQNPLTPDSNLSNPSRDYAAIGKKGGLAKSERARSASARNATKHGLTGQTFFLLHTEDEDAFAAHRARLYKSLAPANAIEATYVDRIVENSWRIARVTCMETSVLRLEIEKQRTARLSDSPPEHQDLYTEAFLGFLALEALAKNTTFESFNRYRAGFERAIMRLHKALSTARSTSQPTELPSLDSLLPETPSVFKELRKIAPDETKLDSSFVSNNSVESTPASSQLETS
jgi:hypothetical protein